MNHPALKSLFTGRWFVFSALVILAIAGLAKLWSAIAPIKIKMLAVADPVTGLQFGHLMLSAGMVELAVACVCLFGKSSKLKLLLIAWLATSFVVYRCGLWWMDWQRPCSCMGNLTDALHISPELADNIMKGVLAYLFTGSYGLLWWQWKAERRKLRNREGGNGTGETTIASSSG